MNFLAHLFLSGNSEQVLIGNFIGDFVKGKKMDAFPPEVTKGIALHREIDHFTDTHPIVKESKHRLREKYRHYAGVLVDMYYDHLLARNWKDYSDISLEEFTFSSYAIIARHINVLPEKARFMFTYMKRDNWLLHYAQTEGIKKALQGMSQRTKFASGLEHGVADLVENYTLFEEEFRLFFPDLRKHVGKVLSE